MANPTVSQPLDVRALVALAAYHLHTAGTDARCEDFQQNPGSSLYERLQEQVDVTVAPGTFAYANGMAAGFELGIKAAIALAASPLSPHVEDMRAIVDCAVESVRSFEQPTAELQR